MENNQDKLRHISNCIEEYKKVIKNIHHDSSEAAISHHFSLLLEKLFSTSNPKFIENYLKNLERNIEARERDLIFSGRLDAFYGNVIIEFKKDLQKFKDVAENQQKKYLATLLNSQKEEKINYLSLITDGILFYLYIPKIKIKEKQVTAEDIILKLIDKIDIFKDENLEFYYFLDRYLFREIEKIPTVKEFVKDFGINSPAFNFAFEDLKEVWEKIKNENPFKLIFDNWDSYLSIVYGNKFGDYDLYLKHTYLSSLVKILISLSLGGKKSFNLIRILKGEFFKELGINNFLEEDFYSWISVDTISNNLINTFNKIYNQLLAFNFDKFIKDNSGEDILKDLYQELVDPETRHDLGEYYTPNWLAQKIVEKQIEKNPEFTFLDPSCGSGTFLYFIIQSKKKLLKNDNQLLNNILNSVSGIDVHPLAVIISKTNYVLALGELLFKRSSNISIPIYLSDSIRLPKLEEERQLSLDEKTESIEINLSNKRAYIPRKILKNNEIYDEILELIKDFSINYKNENSNLQTFRIFVNNYFSSPLEDDIINTLFTVAEAIKELIEENKDTIWIYILKNLYKPYFLYNKFDHIIGNPPWLSYRFIERKEYQEFLKEIITNKYKLCPNKSQLITQLELSTLFFIRTVDLYLKKDGKISFILPRSIFSSKHHASFRENNFTTKIGFTELWDLIKVKPLFNVPSCVLFGEFNKNTKYPIKTTEMEGKLPNKNISLAEAQINLKENIKEIYLIKTENTSFWDYEKNKYLLKKSSYYRNLFDQGASIVPRAFWFIDIKAESNFGVNIKMPLVKTPDEIIKNSKGVYNKILEGNIEDIFIFKTLLSSDIIPFGHLVPRFIVLPIKLRDNEKTYIFNSEDEMQKAGHIYLAKWINKVEKLWESLRSEKQKKFSAIQWLNYRNKLTSQKIRNYKVLYTTSGTNICCVVVPSSYFSKGSLNLETKNFIVDTKTYYCDLDSQEEAFYLMSIINSGLINKFIKPMQSKGLFGPRDIHKTIWEIGIPKFDLSNKIHNELVKLAEYSTKKVFNFLDNKEEKTHINKLRNSVKALLKPEIETIDKILENLINY